MIDYSFKKVLKLEVVGNLCATALYELVFDGIFSHRPGLFFPFMVFDVQLIQQLLSVLVEISKRNIS